jgi:hypothetical protein
MGDDGKVALAAASLRTGLSRRKKKQAETINISGLRFWIVSVYAFSRQQG